MIYERARNKALNNGQRYHVACILYRKNKPIYIGVNSNKTHPRFQRITPDGSLVSTLHAEMSVLRFSKPGDVLEVLRFLSSGEVTMARPCRHCQAFIQQAQISSLKYTNWHGEWEEF
jgi:cytidine deaminase